MRRDLLIIIPAYNEARSIQSILEGLQQGEVGQIADVLVVNDASRDDTNALVKQKRVSMVSHVFNLGYGSAIRLGYKYAVRRGYKYVIQMDADGQHDICNVLRIYAALKEPDHSGRCPDIVLGSRFLPESKPYQVSVARGLAMAWFRFLVRLLGGQRISDPTTGLQGLNRKAFLYYSQMGHFDDKYPDANMLIQMLLLRFSIREVPAVMHQRESGVSMHSGWKPAYYMVHMMASIITILLRHACLRIDGGIGERDTIWKL